MTILGSRNLSTLGLPHIICQSSLALREGICEIAHLWDDRSAYTWSAAYNLSK